MFNSGKERLLGSQDRLILEWAETLLEPDRPDCFDLRHLGKVSGIPHQTILERFPFPELLSIGILVLVWEGKRNFRPASQSYVLNRPNGFKLNASDWEPDKELLKHFAAHPIVQSFLEGEPPMRFWFRKSGKASLCYT